jgi:hypothetical protein
MSLLALTRGTKNIRFGQPCWLIWSADWWQPLRRSATTLQG